MGVREGVAAAAIVADRMRRALRSLWLSHFNVADTDCAQRVPTQIGANYAFGIPNSLLIRGVTGFGNALTKLRLLRKICRIRKCLRTLYLPERGEVAEWPKAVC